MITNSKKSNSHLNFATGSNFTKSKRSQAHVEMILATTLFIGFLIFVFIFLRSSLKTTQEIPTDEIQREILERTQQEVGKLSVIVGTLADGSRACFNLDAVEDEYGTDFRSVSDPSNPGRYTIYYGHFFNKNPITCAKANENFTLGGYIEEKLVIDTNITLLVNEYETDYSALKQDLGVDNFAFEFRDENNEIIEALSVRGKIPENVDIISKDFPVRVIDANAQMTNRILNIKAWR